MDTLLSIIGYGILALLGLAALLVLLALLVKALIYTPMLLCAAAGFLCLGLPFYWAIEGAWWCIFLAILTFPLGGKCFAWMDKLSPDAA